MNKRSFEIMCKLLRPKTAEEITALVQARTGTAWPHQEILTLADAGVEEEVRDLLKKPSAE